MTHINQRRGNAASWTSTNPVLPEGQVGWESDTLFGKLGDGVTAWNDLPYAVQPGPVTSVNGDTGDVVLNKADVGLSNVDNTNDAGKPVSVAQQAAIDAKVVGTVTNGDTTHAPSGDAVYDFVAAALLAAHPVGSIYTSTVNTDPATFLGGTWVAFGAGRVLVGVDGTQTEFDTVEETGGSKTVTLTSANLPPHTHTIAHTHDVAVRQNAATFGGAGTAASPTVSGTLADITTSASSAANSGNGPGSSTPVNNLPPYITVYMFKRTA